MGRYFLQGTEGVIHLVIIFTYYMLLTLWTYPRVLCVIYVPKATAHFFFGVSSHKGSKGRKIKLLS